MDGIGTKDNDQIKYQCVIIVISINDMCWRSFYAGSVHRSNSRRSARPVKPPFLDVDPRADGQ